jgi:hypothetical protein
MNATEQAAVKVAKKIWLEGSTAVQTELEKLIIGERGFLRNNVWPILAINAAAFTGIGWVAHWAVHAIAG